MRHASLRLLLASLLLLAAACGSADPPPPSTPAMLVVENASQYVLEEVRLHFEPSYLAAPNLVEVPLAEGESLVEYRSGTIYLTVFRERFRGGDLLALTTESPIALQSQTGYRVRVFDQSFRVLPEAYIPPIGTTTTSTVP